MRFIFLFFISVNVYALSFDEAAKSISKHDTILYLDAQSKMLKEDASINGSWGDSVLKLSAKNFPKKTLKDNETPMTGVELGVSQKISLTTKYLNKKRSSLSMSKSVELSRDDQVNKMLTYLWEILILDRKVNEEIELLNENLSWINKNLKVTKKLYANGKTSQQALLEIQIRKSEIESEISNKNFEKSQIKDRLNFLISKDQQADIEKETIPWKLLSNLNIDKINLKHLALKEKVKASEYNLTASKLNYVPDLTFSVGYTKRSNIDGRGDFVGAQIQIPLPTSSVKYSTHSKAIQQKYMSLKELTLYEKEKLRDTSILQKEIRKLKEELKILKDKTISFARNSRAITAKSYGIGNANYIELLQSEFKLQNILKHKIMLEAQRDIKAVSLIYILGGKLHE